MGERNPLDVTAVDLNHARSCVSLWGPGIERQSLRPNNDRTRSDDTFQRVGGFLAERHDSLQPCPPELGRETPCFTCCKVDEIRRRGTRRQVPTSPRIAPLMRNVTPSLHCIALASLDEEERNCVSDEAIVKRKVPAA
jgi:hypothetical protein